LGRSVRRRQPGGETAAPARYGCDAMPAVKRPGVAESSPGAETQRRKTCGTLHPAHVTSGKPWREAPMVDGGRPEEWPHLSLGHPPTAGEWCIPAPQVEAGHCGSPASSPEPQGAVGSERRLHRPDRVCGPCRERGSPPEQCADEPAIHGLRRSRRRQSTRSRGKPGTGERTPGERHAQGPGVVNAPLKGGGTMTAKAMPPLSVMAGAERLSLESPVPSTGHAGCGGGREETYYRQ
jgi:hypothetical protein